MDFPQLEDIWLVNVIITGNPNLKELLLPVINRITAGDSHGLIIANNPQLEILHFPKIEILYGGSYHYENNTTLRSIQFDRLHTVLLDRFVVLKNPALEIIEVILSRKTLDAMTILNNRNLLSIPSEFCEGNRTMTIRGNAQLSREILEELRAAANESSSQIQEFGECIFKEPVRNLAALDVCVYVYGQLDKAKFNVKKIEGCVKTQNTQLRSLSFLDIDISGCAGQHLVTGDNPILCKVDHLDSQKKIPVTFEGKYIKDCDKLCYTLNENCEFFGGQLVFNATTQHSAKKLKILKRILGGLKIDKSPAESIDFPNLEEIRVSKAPALQITDNPALKSLTMKKLPKITVDDGTKPAIKITGNKQLKQEALKQFLNELYDDWVKKTPSCEYVDSVESFISDSNCGGGGLSKAAIVLSIVSGVFVVAL